MTSNVTVVRGVCAQGDILIVRVAAVPAGVPEVLPEGGRHVVAHSETGHHHTVEANGVVRYAGPADPFTCYLQVSGPFADLVHNRPFDTHETLRLEQGTWEVRRQREHTPEGHRMVVD